MKTSLKEHYHNIRSVLLLILVLNWVVAAAKIIYGLISRTSSMTADGFHSLSDGASNIIGLVGITLASQPKDKDHPYGHKKYETFFSLGIAVLLLLVCIQLAQQGVRRIMKPVTPNVDFINFAIMIITICINFWVMKYEYRRGKSLKSDILVSDSMHTQADVLTSFSVILALIAVKLGFPIIDPIATIMISLFIAYEAFQIMQQASRVLCDQVVIMDDKKISCVVLGVKGVAACHKIRSRGREDDIYIDLHAHVRPDMRVDEAHQISYEIESAIKKEIPQVTDVVVHIEPHAK
ncbi:MAG: cation transporter [Candidatus Omnitrophica bacterium CG07_land_8_20_14_0_80_42_15]|uniref:Cation transporter n=1 Tax=Candidatus Aquitaenariimonas noxiae TaxID=1974741 RepID=A0A2J0KT72_9BACT|nr:MAG: cation transporter [Candidatus Omnitrophica bacterium CG07_land_8_20_14_0_80_42_15]